jgi:hypothetical protein
MTVFRTLLGVVPLLALSLFVPACVDAQGIQVRNLGAVDLSCPADRVNVYTTANQWPTTDYVARGCGKWAEYECVRREDGAQRCFPRQHADVHEGPG